MGDASIGKIYNKSKTLRISWEHCRKQEEYAIWKAKKMGIEYSIYRRDRLDKRTGKIYESTTVYSTGIDFSFYRNLFYPNGKKITTQDILGGLTPASIAVWYCDDGNMYYNRKNCHLTIAIHKFSDKNEIISYFKKKWDLNFKQNSGSIRLTSCEQVKKFEKIFKRFYPKCMDYKTLDFQKEKYNNNLSYERKKFRNKKYR